MKYYDSIMKTLSPYYFHALGKLVKPDSLAILSINDKSAFLKRYVFKTDFNSFSKIL